MSTRDKQKLVLLM